MKHNRTPLKSFCKTLKIKSKGSGISKLAAKRYIIKFNLEIKTKLAHLKINSQDRTHFSQKFHLLPMHQVLARVISLIGPMEVLETVSQTAQDPRLHKYILALRECSRKWLWPSKLNSCIKNRIKKLPRED